LELRPHIRPVLGWRSGQHLRQRLLHPLREKLRLQRHRSGQQLPQRPHFPALKSRLKLRARTPRTRAFEPRRDRHAARCEKAHQLRKALV